MCSSLAVIVFLAGTFSAIWRSPQAMPPATSAVMVNPLQALSTQEQAEYKQAAQAANTGKYTEAMFIYE